MLNLITWRQRWDEEEVLGQTLAETKTVHRRKVPEARGLTQNSC